MMGQHVGLLGQNRIVGQNGGGPVVPVGEDSGLGSDPFNLMPIIEHHQRVRKRSLWRHVGRLSSNTSQSSA